MNPDRDILSFISGEVLSQDAFTMLGSRKNQRELVEVTEHSEWPRRVSDIVAEAVDRAVWPGAQVASQREVGPQLLFRR